MNPPPARICSTSAGNSAVYLLRSGIVDRSTDKASFRAYTTKAQGWGVLFCHVIITPL